MKSLSLIFILLVPFYMDAKNLHDVCIETKSNLLKRPSYDITWVDYIEKEYSNVEKFVFDKYSFPILVGKKREETAFGMVGDPELKFISRVGDKIIKMQSVNIDTFLSKQIENSTKYPTLVGQTTFLALKNSFSVSVKDLDCDQFIGIDKGIKLKKEPIRKLILVLLKSTFSPYNAIDVIDIKDRNAFLIRKDQGFEYHEMINGKTLSVTLFSDDSNDIDRFISNLPQNKGLIANSIIANKIMKSIKSKSVADWEVVLELMDAKEYSELSVDVITEHIGYLTSQ